MADDPHIPPGWDYNPSDWGQRLPIIVLALIGAGVATYLALWQYDVIGCVFEPFFHNPDGQSGTEKILGTRLSFPFQHYLGIQWLAVSDAALGAFAYLLDAVTGVIGGPSRWRRMPWIVIVFAIFVGPLGLVSVGLTIAQPVLYGQWCTLCLTSAMISVLMIGPAMDEAMASLQYMRRVHDAGDRSWWGVFWGLGDTGRIIPLDQAPRVEPRPRRLLPGLGVPLHQARIWAQGVGLACGIWLMLSPGVLGYFGAARINDRVVGPFVATFACVAMWEATRALRWWNLPLAAWMVLAAFVLDYPPQGRVSVALTGVILGAVSLVRGAIRHRFGGGWAALWRKDPYGVGPDAERVHVPAR